jgi:hypothetical protein
MTLPEARVLFEVRAEPSTLEAAMRCVNMRLLIVRSQGARAHNACCRGSEYRANGRTSWSSERGSRPGFRLKQGVADAWSGPQLRNAYQGQLIGRYGRVTVAQRHIESTPADGTTSPCSPPHSPFGDAANTSRKRI